jgi:PHD/YefM family antitoxin component YafN of YafNO toxin-antitoxin module
MKTVNALTLRNRLGEVLEHLEKTKEPILLSKGRKVRAAIVHIEDFERRFLDKITEEKRQALLEQIKSVRKPKIEDIDSILVLRSIRGELK